MLTSDLVRVRRRGDEISVSPLGPRNRPMALEAAEQYLAITKAHVGLTKAEWTAACTRVQMPARAKKLTDGLRKLIEDRCTFAEADGGREGRIGIFAGDHLVEGGAGLLLGAFGIARSPG